MQVICTDGTVLQCERFEAIDSGVLLFGEQPDTPTDEGDETEEGEADEEANAFVPIHQLRFVLPEGVQPGRAGSQSLGQSMPAQSTGGAPPPGPTAPPQGQTPTQQPMGGQPPTRGGPERQSRQPGPERRR